MPLAAFTNSCSCIRNFSGWAISWCIGCGGCSCRWINFREFRAFSNTSASSRITLLSFWEYASFTVNTFIFLLIGVEIDLGTLWRTLPAIILAVLAYQVGRVLTVYPLLAGIRLIDRPIPLRWQHLLFLGNIKGSLSMALALSLPETLPGRDVLIALVFGSVLVSLVGQGLSLPWVVKRLKLSKFSETQQQVEELQAQLMTGKAAQDELDSLLKSGVLPKAVYEEMRSAYQVRIAGAEKILRELYNRRPDELDGKSNSSGKLDAIRRVYCWQKKERSMRQCGSEFSQKKLCADGYKILMNNC